MALRTYQVCSKCWIDSPNPLTAIQRREQCQPILQTGKLSWETKFYGWLAARLGLEAMQGGSEATP